MIFFEHKNMDLYPSDVLNELYYRLGQIDSSLQQMHDRKPSPHTEALIKDLTHIRSAVISQDNSNDQTSPSL